MKAFGDDKKIVTEKLKFVFGRVENIVEKGKNAGNWHFSFSHHVFNPIKDKNNYFCPFYFV